MYDVIIIGGGLAGLACAARLAHAGLQVCLLEKSPAPGGKMARLEHSGFRWDLGPSLLTMPQVIRELWQDCGKDAVADLDFIELESTCKYRWSDGTIIDEDRAFWSRPEVAAYLNHARGIYELSADAFLNHAPDEIIRQFRPGQLQLLKHLPKVADLRSLHRLNRSFFSDHHLLQLFDRFATYNGSSPYKTPAVFSIIPYVQAQFRGHYLKGGMYSLAAAITRLAENFGAKIRCQQEVRSVASSDNGFKVETASGDTLESRRIVCNMDAIEATRRLFGKKIARKAVKSQHQEPSMSGFILLLGMARQFPELDHHNILFSDDYPLEFQQISNGCPASQPTIYISIGARSDPAMAPEGKEGWFVLVNAPATGSFDWQQGASDYAELVLDRMADFGINPRPAIECQRTFTPEDFARRDNAWRGTLYGFASHGLTSSFTRPAIKRRDLPGIFFTGGTTHPGGGVPLVLLSGKIVARKVMQSLN